MKKKTLFLCLLLFSLLNCVACGKETAAIRIERQAEVSLEQAAEVERAAEETKNYFAEQGRFLPGDLQIVLVKDRPAYLSELQRRFALDELQANRIAKGTDAMSGGAQIVMNIAGVPNERRKTFLTAHELTHFYQRATGVRAGAVKWLLEGGADFMGARIVERKGFFSLAAYRNNWLSGLRSYPVKPHLSALRSSEGWSDSISRYGSDLTYKSAALAVLMLTERYGEGALWRYFALAGQGKNAETAFFESFGCTLQEFETELDALLAVAA